MDPNDKGGENIDIEKLSGEHQVERPYYVSASSITQWIIKYSGGFVKNQTQANCVLVAFFVLVVVIFFVVIFAGGLSQPISGEIPSDQVVPQ